MHIHPQKEKEQQQEEEKQQEKDIYSFNPLHFVTPLQLSRSCTNFVRLKLRIKPPP